jgi:asparagine synthase (glutamine-hydrolysing)
VKGIFSHHEEIFGKIRRAQGYMAFSPYFWIQKDPFSNCQEYLEGRDGRQYCIFIRGDSNEYLIDSIKRYILGETSGLPTLKGRWLIVIYGESAGMNPCPEITLISDRFGSHRTYYAYDGRFLLWSTNFSEILELRRQNDQEPGLDISALNGYLHFLHQPPSKTLVQGVYILPPGSYLFMSKEKEKIEKYGSVEFNPPIKSNKKAVCEIKHLLDEVIIPKVTPSGEKTGLLLSGGIDSSLLASICRKEDQDLITYTVGFEGEDDEREAAKAVAHHFKLQWREVLISPEDIPGLLWEVTRRLGFPSGNPSSLATFLVARQAKKEVGRLISGIGSDELFAGHAKHILARHWPLARRMISLKRRGIFPFNGNHKKSLIGRPVNISHYLDLYTFFDVHQLQRLLLPEYLSFENTFYSDLHRDIFQEEQFLTDIFAWLADDLLPIATTLVADYGIKLILPFCEDEMVDCAARIPLKMKVKGKQGKWILRNTYQYILPSWVFERKRQGFTIPIGRWLRGPLKGLLHSFLSIDAVEKRGIFNPEAVQRMVEAHLNGTADLSLPLWGLMTLEVWQRIFIDPQA